MNIRQKAELFFTSAIIITLFACLAQASRNDRIKYLYLFE